MSKKGELLVKMRHFSIDSVCEKIFFVFVAAVLLFMVFGAMFMADERQENTFDCELLSLDWYQVLPDGEEIPVEIPCKLDVKPYETACIKAVIPEDMPTKVSKWLCLLPTMQDAEVYIGGELREQHSTKDSRPWGTSSATAYLFVPLAPDDGGKELTVRLTSDTAYSGVVQKMYAGTAFGIWYNYAKNNAFAVMLAIFMFILSVISIIVSIVLTKKTKRKFYLYFLGEGLLMLAIWVLAQSPVRQLYYQSVSLAGIVTHITIYFFVIPIAIYLNYAQDKRYGKFYRAYILFYILFYIFAVFCEVTDALPFKVVHTTNSVIQLLGVSMIAVTIAIDIKKGYIRNYKLIAIGITGLGICGILQLVVYFMRTIIFDGSLLCLGAVFLLIMALVDTIRDYMSLGVEIKSIMQKNENLTYQIMETLVHTIEAKDEYTKGHSTRVAEYSRLLAGKMGMNEEEQMSIFFMATLHDIGKISIDDDIINKPGRLTDEEYAIIKKHSEIGYNILSNMAEIKDIKYGARWHHERYDGKGYPDGLSGEEIPVFARIIAVADTYDAMTSNRSYREVMPQEKVKAEIKRVRGTQLDPHIADCMIELIDEDKDYTMKQK